MAYVSSQEIVDRIGQDAAIQLTTDSGDVVNTALIDAIIEEVEGEIDQVVRRRTAETITEEVYAQTFAMLRGKAVTMTIYRLKLRRDPVGEDWKAANDKAVEWLDKLAKGEVDLPDEALNEPRFASGCHPQNAAKVREL